MASISTGTLKFCAAGVSVLSECIELYDQLAKEDGPLTVPEKLDAVVKALFIGLQVTSMGAKAKKVSLETRRDIKLAEYTASLAHLVIDSAAQADTDQTFGRKLEIFLGNLAKSARLAAEDSVLSEKIHLRETPEESKKSEEGRPLESERFLKGAQACASICLIGEVVAKTHGLTYAGEQLGNFLSYIGLVRQNHRDRMASDDVKDLEKRGTIPGEFHDDEVFSQYICPITLCPIRYPLRDPRTGHLYEAHAIIGWLERSPTSPLTRASLRTEDLEKVPEIQDRIERRLRELQCAVRDSTRL